MGMNHIVYYRELACNEGRRFEIAGFCCRPPIGVGFRETCISCAMLHPDWYVVWKSGAKVVSVYHGNRMWQGKMIPTELAERFSRTGDYNE